MSQGESVSQRSAKFVTLVTLLSLHRQSTISDEFRLTGTSHKVPDGINRENDHNTLSLLSSAYERPLVRIASRKIVNSAIANCHVPLTPLLVVSSPLFAFATVAPRTTNYIRSPHILLAFSLGIQHPLSPHHQSPPHIYLSFLGVASTLPLEAARRSPISLYSL